MTKGNALSKGDRVFDAVNLVLMTLTLIMVLYPLVYIVSASFSSGTALMSGRVWLYPVEPSITGYTGVFKNKSVMTGYANSGFYTFFGTIVNVVVTMIAAYPLARKDLRGRGFLMKFFMFTMLFSGGMIPTYMLVRSLRLIDTRLAMILPGAMAFWNLAIARTYIMSTIPGELYESAEIDGAGDLRVFASIVLPLSTPIIAVTALFYAVGHWNSYFNALIYLKRQALYPLQIILRNILILNSTDYTMLTDVTEIAERQALAELLKYSLIVVASLPVLALYPFVQKYFVKGVMIGSIKG